MAESRLHFDLVECLAQWIRTCDFLGGEATLFIDNPDTSIQDLPFVLGAHRPDVYAESRKFNRKVIGEAKTPSDLKSRHSITQIEAFLKSSENESFALILATQWDYVRYAKCMLKQMSARMKLHCPKYAVIDQFGKVIMGSNDWL